MDIALLACRRHQVADAKAERAQTAKKQSKYDRQRQLQFRQKNQADPGKAVTAAPSCRTGGGRR